MSNVQSIKTKDKDLIITFTNSRVYKYQNAASHLPTLLTETSKGKYLHQHIIPFYPASELINTPKNTLETP